MRFNAETLTDGGSLESARRIFGNIACSSSVDNEHNNDDDYIDINNENIASLIHTNETYSNDNNIMINNHNNNNNNSNYNDSDSIISNRNTASLFKLRKKGVSHKHIMILCCQSLL